MEGTGMMAVKGQLACTEEEAFDGLLDMRFGGSVFLSVIFVAKKWKRISQIYRFRLIEFARRDR